MDNESTNKAAVLPSPSPIAPREAAIVDARAITFRWEPVDDATAYRIEVARDAAFNDVVFDEEVSADRTTLAVRDVFPADEETFFWRVLARGEGDWSRGERIESFVSGTPEDVAQHIRTPDEEEELGPIEGLVQTASEMVVDELSGSEEAKQRRLEREREMGVAEEGIPTGQILAIALSISVAVAILVVLLFQWTNLTTSSIREATVDPEDYTEIRQVEADAARKLSRYEVVDEEAGTYRIPIDRAMDLIVNEAYEQGDRTYSADAPFVERTQP